MLDPVVNIKTLMTEGSWLPINYSHSVIAERSLCPKQFEKFYGRYHDLVNPFSAAVSKHFRFDGLNRSIVRLTNTGISFSLTNPRICGYGGSIITGR